MDDAQLIDAVQGGNHEVPEIADAVDKHPGHMYRVCSDAAERGVLGREKDGHSWHYFIPDEEEVSETAADADTVQTSNGRMPVFRDYDWDSYVPEADTYMATDGEVEEFVALVNAREERPVHGRLGGPTGCGKTSMAKRFAAVSDIPCFTLQGKYTMREGDLLGSPVVIGDTTVWVDGVLTKALLASKEGPVVLLIDEINRARAQAKSVLYSALDHRAEVTLDGGRGGEPIEGKPENLIVVGTMNEGEKHTTEDMDHAEKRRLGAKWNVDYLGRNHPSAEVALLTGDGVEDRDAFEDVSIELEDGTLNEYDELPEGLAREMVEVANRLRDEADDTLGLDYGVPTDALQAWAHATRAFAEAGITNPVMRAARTMVARPYYEDDDYDTVLNTIKSALDDAPVDADEYEAWAGDMQYECDRCGFVCSTADHDSRGLQGTCPDCGDGLGKKQK